MSLWKWNNVELEVDMEDAEFYDLFDDLFGDGTGDQLFTGKMNSRICEECYDSFLAECQKGILAAAERRNNRMNKFRPNRQQRRKTGK